VADEHLARGHRVDVFVRHAATGRQQQAEQGDSFVDRRARGAPLPVRLVVLLLHEVRTDLFHPARIDARDIARVHLRRLDLLGAHDPGRSRLVLSGAGMDRELRAVRAQVLGLLLALRDLRQQAREQRAVDRGVLGGLRVQLERELALHHFHDLAVDVRPLDQPQVREEVLLAPATQFRA
jgi:hypothetical protein